MCIRKRGRNDTTRNDTKQKSRAANRVRSMLFYSTRRSSGIRRKPTKHDKKGLPATAQRNTTRHDTAQTKKHALHQWMPFLGSLPGKTMHLGSLFHPALRHDSHICVFSCEARVFVFSKGFCFVFLFFLGGQRRRIGLVLDSIVGDSGMGPMGFLARPAAEATFCNAAALMRFVSFRFVSFDCCLTSGFGRNQ